MDMIVPDEIKSIDERTLYDFSLAVSKGYKANNMAFLNDDTLTCDTSKDFRPHMLRARIDSYLEKINNPRITTDVKYNSNHSSRHLEVYIDNKKIIITQNTVKRAEKSPRPAKFRYNLQDLYGQYVFDYFYDSDNGTELNDLIYLQLIHGSDDGINLSFVNLGTPIGQTKWICYFDIPIISLDEDKREEIEDTRTLTPKREEDTGDDEDDF